MTSIEQSRKLRHPYFKMMDLSEKELIPAITAMSREEIINWLQWNDSNGVYSDKQSIDEFGNIMSKKEAEKIILRQILEA